MSILVFDIETIPDLESGRKLYNLQDLSDKDTAHALSAIRRNKVGHDFLPLYLQKIVAISLVLSQDFKIKVWSLGTESSSEKDLIERFFLGIEKYTPILVSWNGCGFDLPVLHYRALLHGISAPTYWENGENQQNFRWNNYLNRFHYRHLDLMDVLASYQSKAFAPLDEIASMLGFPGKMGMSGNKVFETYLQGDIKKIRDYCETDVLNTYGIFLRFELMRGSISSDEYKKSIQSLKEFLMQEENRPHLQEFVAKMDV